MPVAQVWRHEKFRCSTFLYPFPGSWAHHVQIISAEGKAQRLPQGESPRKAEWNAACQAETLGDKSAHGPLEVSPTWPDERGWKRQEGFGGFQAAPIEADAVLQDACCQGRAIQADVNGFVFTIFAVGDELGNAFIGLRVQMGFGLVDAGAQRGVCGQDQFDKLVKYLGGTLGLKPIQIPTLQMGAVGVGGATKFLSS